MVVPNWCDADKVRVMMLLLLLLFSRALSATLVGSKSFVALSASIKSSMLSWSQLETS